MDFDIRTFDTAYYSLLDLLQMTGEKFVEEYYINCEADFTQLWDRHFTQINQIDISHIRFLLLPKVSPCAIHAFNYLRSRGLDEEIIHFCFQSGRIYESLPYHNVVFVGLDKYNKPRYANLRGIGTDFIGDANGSDKRFSFSIPAQGSTTLHLFESAIDLLSYATLVKQHGGNWQRDHLVSLAGVYKPKENLQESSLPLTLKRYLTEYPNIQKIILRLDNDRTGGYMAKALVALLSDRYVVSVQPPPSGKDYNDYLCMSLGLPITHRKGKAQER